MNRRKLLDKREDELTCASRAARGNFRCCLPVGHRSALHRSWTADKAKTPLAEWPENESAEAVRERKFDERYGVKS